MGVKRWNVAKIDKDAAVELANECGISSFCALLLLSRGISDPTDAEDFLANELELPDPFDFIDMDKAAERIRRAVDSFEKIAVFGDYDADGVTSSALLYSHLVKMGANVEYRLPTRDEGYGMTCDAVDELNSRGVKLIVTVDNGISAHNEIEYAASCGIDVVVTDHHIPPDTLPNAVAVVDPKREDCYSDFKDYAGVGVAFMLCCALSECECEELIDDYGDLVTLGTIADIMPLYGYNRKIVAYGLRLMSLGERPGLRALMSAAGIGDKPLTAVSTAFMLAPRINAAGRMLTPDAAVKLLLCEDDDEAEEYAERLNSANAERQAAEREITEQAQDYLENNPKAAMMPIIIITGEGWPHGVIGIAASKISNKYCKPCIVFSVDGDTATGSARSYDGVSIYDIINRSAQYLIRYGGHSSAAGMSIETAKLPEFSRAVNEAAVELYGALPFDSVNICCKLNPSALSTANVHIQNMLEPFGAGNQPPIYGLYNMKIVDLSYVGQGKHLRLTLERADTRVTAMKFFTSSDNFFYRVGDVVDTAVTLDINSYRGAESLSIIVKEIKPSAADYDNFLQRLRSYEYFSAFGTVPDGVDISRDDIAAVYKKIRLRRIIRADDSTLCMLFGASDYLKLRLILDILNEMNLARVTVGDCITVQYIEAAGKVDLNSSAILAKIREE